MTTADDTKRFYDATADEVADKWYPNDILIPTIREFLNRGTHTSFRISLRLTIRYGFGVGSSFLVFARVRQTQTLLSGEALGAAIRKIQHLSNCSYAGRND